MHGKGDDVSYNIRYGTWTTPTGSIPVASTYRIAWRRMAATTGFRTLYPAIIPPGTMHVNGVIAAGPIDSVDQVFSSSVASSFLIDFFLRSSGVGDLYGPVFEGVPFKRNFLLSNAAARLFLRINCLTSAYASLWEKITGEHWAVDVPLRKALERQEAQNEIDAIVALSLGITADELCMIYRTQFPVMRRYDQEDLYDAHGRKVPNTIKKLLEQVKEESLTVDQRTWVHPQSQKEYVFEYPFSTLDRESSLREAYESFQQSVL